MLINDESQDKAIEKSVFVKGADSQASGKEKGYNFFKRITIYLSAILLTFTVGLTILIKTHSSENDKRQEYFEKRISEIMSGKNRIVVKMNELTNFEWNKVRIVKVDGVLLVFYSNTGETTMHLPSGKFYVDEGYMPRSLDGRRLQYNDSILLIVLNFKDFSMIKFVNPVAMTD